MTVDEMIEVARDSGQFPLTFPFPDQDACIQRAELHDVEDPPAFCAEWQRQSDNS